MLSWYTVGIDSVRAFLQVQKSNKSFHLRKFPQAIIGMKMTSMDLEKRTVTLNLEEPPLQVTALALPPKQREGNAAS